MGYYDNLDENALKVLVGRKIARVQMNTDYLVFTDTDGNEHWFGVYGDCCSSSYFYDIYAINHLVSENNGPVIGIETVELNEPQDANAMNCDCCQAYGFRLVTEHRTWRNVSTVFSFRNDSNGYYGGTLTTASPDEGAREFLVDISDREWYVAQ